MLFFSYFKWCKWGSTYTHCEVPFKQVSKIVITYHAFNKNVSYVLGILQCCFSTSFNCDSLVSPYVCIGSHLQSIDSFSSRPCRYTSLQL